MSGAHTAWVVGVNRTQDASICVLGSDGAAVATQKERLTRGKHAWGALGDVRSVYVPRIGPLADRIDHVVECYSSDPERHEWSAYQDELRGELPLAPSARIESISHHLAHLYSCYIPSGYAECAVMIIDCAGSPASAITEAWPGQKSSAPDAVEIASFYHMAGDAVRCIKKQLWSFDWSSPAGLGAFYHMATRRIFDGEGNEGKVMALASLGSADAMGLPRLTVREGEVTIPDEWVQVLTGPGDYKLTGAEGDPALGRAADLAAAAQTCFETALVEVARWLQQVTGSTKLCFAGGTALNCPGNSAILRQAGFSQVYIPAAPHDGGTAIGCALYGLARLRGPASARAFSWRNDYLGVPRDCRAIADAATPQPGIALHVPADLPAAVARCIADGAVVGLFQARSEFGPRALGNRSILADPRDGDIQRRINETVKGRELFRPLAPTALKRSAAHYFDWLTTSPFMQYSVPVRASQRRRIPGVVHSDGTARVQILQQAENPLFFQIIDEFERLTGVPMVLNTSFNGPNEPIVETVEDALDCFLASGIDVLACPPYLLMK